MLWMWWKVMRKSLCNAIKMLMQWLSNIIIEDVKRGEFAYLPLLCLLVWDLLASGTRLKLPNPNAFLSLMQNCNSQDRKSYFYTKTLVFTRDSAFIIRNFLYNCELLFQVSPSAGCQTNQIIAFNSFTNSFHLINHRIQHASLKMQIYAIYYSLSW